MEIPIKAIIKLMRREIQEHYAAACSSLCNEVQRGFLHLAHREIIDRLDRATTEDDLQSILSDLDYRMSVQEWIDSL